MESYAICNNRFYKPRCIHSFFSKYIFGHFVEVIPIGYHCSRRCSRYLCVSISLQFGPRGPARHHTGTWRPSSRASSRARRAHYWSCGPPGVIPGLQHGVRASAISTGPRLSISTLYRGKFGASISALVAWRRDHSCLFPSLRVRGQQQRLDFAEGRETVPGRAIWLHASDT